MTIQILVRIDGLLSPFGHLERGFYIQNFAKADRVAAIRSANGYSLKMSTDSTQRVPEIMKEAHESGEDGMVSGSDKFEVKSKYER